MFSARPLRIRRSGAEPLASPRIVELIHRLRLTSLSDAESARLLEELEPYLPAEGHRRTVDPGEPLSGEAPASTDVPFAPQSDEV